MKSCTEPDNFPRAGHDGKLAALAHGPASLEPRLPGRLSCSKSCPALGRHTQTTRPWLFHRLEARASAPTSLTATANPVRTTAPSAHAGYLLASDRCNQSSRRSSGRLEATDSHAPGEPISREL
ncbi:uncharacterized protein PFL1_00962 [Pseudozyma flocculosa PF-1]|uniref:uncharacterized protein n=1 Tax=Pseudozyma flocculosa PF-1 TaxID=1277687 RepID=UPI00045608CE|nr:uncharacterized protein PFL1_00962 [Pseudozyma flocculosa PF-1]EPQ31629.1 hypothetical protein PFL1_00962 [Pseudozyma flocculosa PF-1]